ncbi:tripartite tricarboxylate transporter substrate binding protein [Polynucleobacter sp. AP-Kolm-20A-A1]|uniref:Bug family tripartite tricarboxylate transporter substrate binding protein n=1 Tax=Polynucleobacter sp. AP-Kolm-20A-A1 TaxID=2081041 RepID=UPI001BFD8FB6|nr:tripartite tricarboxylate transporter substrate binding protein [Polynucleobacter sp. AP-Kolm-20A-A1]QWE21309.1 tripartite tricarboxylate transporter substrate binding protein [Polynucleobacter sp. AP-Kolm-20A-A1]
MKKIIFSLLLVTSALFGANLFAQEYPNKPIKVLVGYAPGGAVDLVARTLGKSLSDSMGQAVVIENKPGGGTNIAVRQLIDSPPDGYTLMVAANALAANMSLYKPQPFDIDKDITPIAMIGRVPVVIATSADGKYQKLSDLIKAAKSNPDFITYGTPGNGATPHMAMKFFEQAAGISLKHIPYKGGSPAITDLIGGQLDLVAVNMLEVAPHVKSGKLKIVAVMSAKRSPLFPDIPTVAESGFQGFEASVWYSLIAPAKTPPAIVKALHAQVEKALQSKEMMERLGSVGGEVSPGTTAQLTSYLNSERKRYEKLVREANIQPD